jgi:anti-sigma regulatory factor (Ser/Thr protein kinase)
VGADARVLLDERFAADAGRLRDVRRRVIDAVVAAGVPPAVADDVALAISEACANIIEHAYHGAAGQSIRLVVAVEPGRLRVVLEDDAPAVDPRAIVPRELDDLRPGGLGVHFIREIMNHVRVEPRPEGGNRLEMTREY